MRDRDETTGPEYRAGALLLPESIRALQGGRREGTSEGMEPRIARLEATLEHVEGDLGVLKTDMRDVRDRLGALAPMRDDVSLLKADVGDLKKVAADTRERQARLEERASHLPTKGWGVGAIVTLVGLMTAIVAFAPKLQALVGSVR